MSVHCVWNLLIFLLVNKFPAASDGGLHDTAAAYGRHVGLAFQLVDDAIDYEAEEEEGQYFSTCCIAVLVKISLSGCLKNGYFCNEGLVVIDDSLHTACEQSIEKWLSLRLWVVCETSQFLVHVSIGLIDYSITHLSNRRQCGSWQADRC